MAFATLNQHKKISLPILFKYFIPLLILIFFFFFNSRQLSKFEQVSYK